MEVYFLELIEYRLFVKNVQFVLDQLKNFAYNEQKFQFMFRKLLPNFDKEKAKISNSDNNIDARKKFDEPKKRHNTSVSLTLDK